MAIEFKCPECGKAYRVADEFAGRRGKCKLCGAATAVPGVPQEVSGASQRVIAPTSGSTAGSGSPVSGVAQSSTRKPVTQSPKVSVAPPSSDRGAIGSAPMRPLSPSANPARSVPLAAIPAGLPRTVVPMPNSLLPLPTLNSGTARPRVAASAANREPNPEDDEDLYTLTPDKALQASARRIPPRSAGVVAASASSAAVAPPISILGYAHAKPNTKNGDRQQFDIGDVFEGNRVKNLYVPMGLILGCTLFQFIAEMFLTRSADVGFQSAAIELATKLAISVPITLLACLLAVKLLDTSFGPVGPAILKISAIALTPGAIAYGVMLITLTLSIHTVNSTSAMVDLGLGGLIALILSLITYFALFMYLFDLEFAEARTMIFLVWFFRFVTLLAFGMILAR